MDICPYCRKKVEEGQPFYVASPFPKVDEIYHNSPEQDCYRLSQSAPLPP